MASMVKKLEVLPSKNMNEDYHTKLYSRFDIHYDMVSDKVRTATFYDAILRNKHLFKNKIVLDVGCGTGILSLFAAKAGASKCYAVEPSRMACEARRVVKVNGFENIINVIRGSVENINLPCKKVDIIISEWMGYCLYFEDMLKSVIFARNKWLRPNGLIFPDLVELFILGSDNSYESYYETSGYESFYDIKLSGLKDILRTQPIQTLEDPNNIVTSKCSLGKISLYTVSLKDLEIHKRFSLKVTCKTLETTVRALVLYFDVYFTHSHTTTMFSTGPFTLPTHWKQTILPLNPILASRDDEIIGFLEIGHRQGPLKFLKLFVEFSFVGKISRCFDCQNFRMFYE